MPAVGTSLLGFSCSRGMISGDGVMTLTFQKRVNSVVKRDYQSEDIADMKLRNGMKSRMHQSVVKMQMQ